ncbi:MAG: Hpt domain-containing protein [Magnetovibrio sp.]|nr:Hpt domain-containing protein [Magnetovibrio sp.]
MPDLNILRQLASDVGMDTALRLLGIFKDDAEKRVAVIGDYLQNGGNVNDLRIQAHSLKGLCLTYGSPAGGEAARALQDACDSGNDGDIRSKAETAFAIIPDEIIAIILAAQTLKGE